MRQCSENRGIPCRAGLFLILLAPLLSGCGSDTYPEDLTYSLRDDPLVLTTPGVQLPHPILPGKLEESIAHLSSAEGGTTANPSKLKPANRQTLNKILLACFGTPARPKVSTTKDYAGSEDVTQKARELKLTDEMLALGSKHYRRHCLHCHGLTGDGRGPTGPWVSPPPRDYRQGQFKFISTGLTLGGGRKPRRADLLRTLHQGVEGTSMPSFALLDEKSLEAMISYVIHLSLRGEVEYETMKPLLTNGELMEDSVEVHVQELLAIFLGRWHQSNSEVIKPSEAPPYVDNPRHDDFQAAVTRGYEFFSNPEGAASCIKCHADFGRQVNFRYDAWGTLVRPANLTKNIYRGGRRPIDLFWRIRGGIIPSAMPEQKPEFVDDGKVWDLVTFVRALPYPELLPADVKQKIYGSGMKEHKVAQK